MENEKEKKEKREAPLNGWLLDLMVWGGGGGNRDYPSHNKS